MRFQVGDIVRISKKCVYYGRSASNPKDMNGKIEKIDRGNAIKVIWNNEEHNYYDEIDLKLRKRG